MKISLASSRFFPLSLLQGSVRVLRSSAGSWNYADSWWIINADWILLVFCDHLASRHGWLDDSNVDLTCKLAELPISSLSFFLCFSPRTLHSFIQSVRSTWPRISFLFSGRHYIWSGIFCRFIWKPDDPEGQRNGRSKLLSTIPIPVSEKNNP